MAFLETPLIRHFLKELEQLGDTPPSPGIGALAVRSANVVRMLLDQVDELEAAVKRKDVEIDGVREARYELKQRVRDLEAMVAELEAAAQAEADAFEAYRNGEGR